MELREGYKQTEVGVIPEDWVLTHLGDIGQFKNGINKGSESFGHGKPFVNLLDVFGKNSLFESGSYGLVDSSDTERNTYDLKKGDVIFIRSSVKPSGVGLTAVVTEDLPQTVYSGFLIRYRDNGKVETNYKKYCFYEEGFRKKVISASSVSANTNINQDNLKRLTLAFPPTKTEQTAIANALSDADAWIKSLTRLIAKKCQIKQGAMQTLLNPYENGRLKAGWAVKKLGDVCQPSSKRINPRVEKLNYKCVELEHIGQETGRVLGFIDSRTQLSQKSVFKKGDVLFSKLRPYLKKYFFAEFDGVCSTEIWVLKSDKNINNRWLFYLVQTEHIIEAANQSTGTKMPRAEWCVVKNTEIGIPTNIIEQTRIATILSDMDKEITTLESKLTKAQQIKQGMMQNLLTGRIRLI